MPIAGKLEMHALILTGNSASRCLAMAEGIVSTKDQTHGQSAEILAGSVASVLGPPMKELEGRIESATRSQAVLVGSIDRLIRELDKLLEMTPMPFVSQPASRLSEIRKRVLFLTTTLQTIEGRVSQLDRAISRDSNPDVPPPV